ncbi:MAG: metallophosphoesterase family protein [Thermodesulfobacteriota bacterium]
MRVVSFTDIHGRFSVFSKSKKLLKSADVVVLSGDITDFGGQREAEKCIKELGRYFTGQVFAVTGNCDYSSAEIALDKNGINIHNSVVLHNGFSFAGLKGSLVTPFSTPSEFTEDDYAYFIKNIEAELKKDFPLIFVSHQPPFNCSCDRLSNKTHVGSREIRAFIEKNKPGVCFTGHIHEAVGTDTIGQTVVVNPGNSFKKNAGVFDFKNGSSQIFIEKTG